MSWEKQNELVQRIILQTIFDFEFNFGKTHTVSFFIGDFDSKLFSHDYHLKSTFGIFSHFDKNKFEEYIDKLVKEGLLKYEAIQKNSMIEVLVLTDYGKRWLDDQHKPALAISLKPLNFDKKLYFALAECRNKIAEERKIKPYKICLNKTLALIARDLPRTLEELDDYKKFSLEFVDEYGQRLLNVIEHYLNQNLLSCK